MPDSSFCSHLAALGPAPLTANVGLGDETMKGLTLIDLLLFMAAAAIASLAANLLSGHFDGPWRTRVFYGVLIIGYPLLGFTFENWFGRVVRFFRRRALAVKNSQNDRK